MEKIVKREHIIGDYVIEEVEECVYKEPDLWIGKVGEEGRVFVVSDWDDALSVIRKR